MNDFYYDAMDIDLEYLRTRLHDIQEMLKDENLSPEMRDYYEFECGEIKWRLGY